MPIDPSMLAKSIGTLTDPHPDQDLPATLQQGVIAAKQLFEADADGVVLVDAMHAQGLRAVPGGAVVELTGGPTRGPGGEPELALTLLRALG